MPILKKEFRFRKMLSKIFVGWTVKKQEEESLPITRVLSL